MTVKNLKLGNYVTDTPSEIIGLVFNASANAKYDTGDLAGVNYPVTAGKTFRIIAVEINAATAGYGLLLYYGDDAHTDGAGPITNGVLIHPKIQVEVANRTVVYPCLINVPAGKYITVYASGGAVGGKIYGYEE